MGCTCCSAWMWPMRVLVLLSVLLVSEIEAQCSRTRGQFPHDVYCDKFYNCWDGNVAVQTCPRGLLFNDHPRKPVCDYPSNVRCAGRRLSRPLVPYGSPCPKAFGTFASTYNCSEFITCVGGLAFRQGCPVGTFYSQDLKVCNYDYLTPCGGAIIRRPPFPYADYAPGYPSYIEDTSVTRPGSSSFPFRPTKTDSSLDHGDSEESPGSGITDGGYAGDSDDGYGKGGGSSGSHGTGTGGGSTKHHVQIPASELEVPYGSLKPYGVGGPANTLLNYRCPIRSGYFPVVGDCGLVIVCIDYQAMLLTCPPGMLFDKRRNLCDLTRYVQCY